MLLFLYNFQSTADFTVFPNKRYILLFKIHSISFSSSKIAMYLKYIYIYLMDYLLALLKVCNNS